MPSSVDFVLALCVVGIVVGAVCGVVEILNVYWPRERE